MYRLKNKLIKGERLEFPPIHDPQFPNLLPFEKPRSLQIDAIDFWGWIYYCRLVKSPFPNPGYDIPWPDYSIVWVAPDGHVIPHGKVRKLEEWREDFLTRSQLKSTKSKRRKELGVLVYLPKIIPDGEPAGRPDHMLNLYHAV